MAKIIDGDIIKPDHALVALYTYTDSKKVRQQIPLRIIYPITDKNASLINSRGQVNGYQVVYNIAPLSVIDFKWCINCGHVYEGSSCCSLPILWVKEPAPSEIDRVIFHKDCPDGFGSAWAIHRFFCNTSNHEAACARVCLYGAKHETKEAMYEVDNIVAMCKGKNVAIVDFAYSPDIILKIKSVCESFILLDHHKSNQLSLLSEPNCYFTMEHSGAYLAWAYMVTGKPLMEPEVEAPKVIQYIQDRDIWTFKLPDSRAIGLAMGMTTCGQLVNMDTIDATEEQSIPTLANIGKHYLKYQESMIERSLMYSSSICTFVGLTAVIINTSLSPSETGELLLASDRYSHCRLAIVWKWVPKNRIYKFHLRKRSTDMDIDLGFISKTYWGGGGHQDSAGFSIEDSRPINDIFETYPDKKNGIKVKYEYKPPPEQEKTQSDLEKIAQMLNSLSSSRSQ